MKKTISLTGLLLAAAVGHADDWPQWMGPKRDNVWRETGIVDAFPKDGPKVLWKAKIAGGYAGPAVANGMVYCSDYASKDQTAEQLDSGNFGRKGSSGVETVRAYNEKTGEEVWKYSYDVKYTVSYPSGPRCTPLVAGDKVYALGAEGHLACLNAKSGSKIWAKELKDEYKTKSALWGYAAHPILEGDKLITLAGGDNSHVVAFNKDTGAEIWKSQTQNEQGYSPPLFTEVNGKRQMIVAGPQAVRGLDPETGKRIWTTPYNADNGSIIMTPVRYGDYLFVGGYRGKNLLVKFKKGEDSVEVVAKDVARKFISPVNVQPFEEDGVIYGYNEDGKLVAFEIANGTHLWSSGGPVGEKEQGSGTAFINKIGDKFIFFTETGDLVLGKLSKTGYAEVSRAHVIDQTNSAFGRKVVWCQPAYANKHCYVRNDKELICLDLSK
jgi:outer membrane protein assembly factor BamB